MLFRTDEKLNNRICVFAGANYGLNKAYAQQAELLGERIGKGGFDLVYGGIGGGLMLALANAAKRNNAKVIGVLPRAQDDPYLLDPKMQKALDLNSRIVGTKSLEMRKQAMIHMSDAVIALAGGIGTFDEIVTVIEHGRGTALRGAVSRLALVNTLGYYDGLKLQLERIHEEGLMLPSAEDCAYFANDANDAMDYVEQRFTQVNPTWKPREV